MFLIGSGHAFQELDFLYIDGLITHQLNQEVIPGAFRAFLLGECCATGVRCSKCPGIYNELKLLSILWVTNQIMVDIFMLGNVVYCCLDI